MAERDVILELEKIAEAWCVGAPERETAGRGLSEGSSLLLLKSKNLATTPNIRLNV